MSLTLGTYIHGAPTVLLPLPLSFNTPAKGKQEQDAKAGECLV